jgi:hypothetical protein
VCPLNPPLILASTRVDPIAALFLDRASLSRKVGAVLPMLTWGLWTLVISGYGLSQDSASPEEIEVLLITPLGYQEVFLWCLCFLCCDV